MTCSRFVHASKTTRRGALKSRARTISRSDGSVRESFELLVAAPSTMCLAFPLQLLQVGLQPIEPCLPQAAIWLDPIGHVLQPARIQAAGPPLCIAAPNHQPRALEHFQVFRDGGHAHIEWLGEFGDRRLA